MHFLVLMASFSLVVPLVHAKTPEQSPRFVVHLLDYLTKDYGGAVANGKILSQSEYHEQVEFCESAEKTNQELDETKGTPEIGDQLKALCGLISKKAEASEVAKLARELQFKVIQVAKLEVSPGRWPSIKHGQQLFAQNCVACHGQTGAGNGPAGVSLNPKPANFLDAHMKEISPFQAFNTIRLGVPGTGMAPFHGLSDKEVWDTAFYILSLRHKESVQARLMNPPEWSSDLLRQVATLSDEKLPGSTREKKDEDRAQWIAALRTHSDDDESGGGSLTVAKANLKEAVADYQSGNVESAKTKALKAYLEGIEPIEPRLKASDPAAVSMLETKMAQVRSTIESRKSADAVQLAVRAAEVEIESAAKILQGEPMSPWVAFLAAVAILLREGFEAVLLIIALLGVIRATDAKKAAAWVHGGWISAVALGIVVWFFSGWLVGMSGAQRETLEGSISLFAVAVLLIVGFWLHSQTEIGRWKAFIQGRVQKALEGKNLWGLASIAFFAAFREAFETVLFLRAIWLEGGDTARMAMAIGVFGSLALLIGMAWAILKYSAKLPVRRLFEFSAVIMAALSVILTGKGLHSLQEIGTVSVTSSPVVFRFDLLGVFPTWETLVSQAVILAVVLALWSYGKRPSQRRSSVSQPIMESQ